MQKLQDIQQAQINYLTKCIKKQILLGGCGCNGSVDLTIAGGCGCVGAI
jgi:hypothetical protein